MEDFLLWDVVVNDGVIIRNAIGLHERQKFAFWDAMIIEAAHSGGAKILLSEDLSHGRTLSDVKIQNPFL